MDKITIFGNRLKKIGIEVKFFGNCPWIYLDTINGKRVTEKFLANHGFTVMFSTTKEFTDIKEIFKIIRKYGRK